MAGCVEDRELDVAQLELVTLVHRVAVLEVELTAMVDFSSGAAGQLERADDVVLVAMRLEDVGDLRSPAVGDFQIFVDITAGIDDGCLAAVSKDV